MPIQRFTVANFRCLESIELDADPNYNLVYGPNAAGKTSVLEALAYLGRGKSFRGAGAPELIRHGHDEFVLFGEAWTGERTAKLGLRNSAAGLEIRIDGEAGGVADLAEALPLQIIDPDIHNLVAGAPEQRRRYLDWIAFHVEHGYLESWRRFRRALKQRNAALRVGAGAAVIHGWNAEFVELAMKIDGGRRRALEVTRDALEEVGVELLASAVGFDYRRGWSQDEDLLMALENGIDRDRQQGNTQLGPHRADLKLSYDERQARKLVSRGQQKLLGCAMILAAAETAQAALEQPLLLLLDDPAAELDEAALQRLMARVAGLGCQIVATSLTPDLPPFPASPAVFHVEQGRFERQG